MHTNNVNGAVDNATSDLTPYYCPRAWGFAPVERSLGYALASSEEIKSFSAFALLLEES